MDAICFDCGTRFTLVNPHLGEATFHKAVDRTDTPANGTVYRKVLCPPCELDEVP